MKIVCRRCDKTMGEIEPLNDPKETLAKCVECVELEKNENLARQASTQVLKDGKKVIFEDGTEGVLTVAGDGSENLSLWDAIFGGKRFFCSKETLKQFEKYLESIPNDELQVTFMHSMTIPLPPKKKGKKKRAEPAPEQEPAKATTYNCTIRVSKAVARQIFDDKQSRMEQVAHILADVAWKESVKERLKDHVPDASKSTNPAI